MNHQHSTTFVISSEATRSREISTVEISPFRRSATPVEMTEHSGVQL